MHTNQTPPRVFPVASLAAARAVSATEVATTALAARAAAGWSLESTDRRIAGRVARFHEIRFFHLCIATRFETPCWPALRT